MQAKRRRRAEEGERGNSRQAEAESNSIAKRLIFLTTVNILSNYLYYANVKLFNWFTSIELFIRLTKILLCALRFEYYLRLVDPRTLLEVKNFVQKIDKEYFLFICINSEKEVLAQGVYIIILLLCILAIIILQCIYNYIIGS